ncbi:MBL fold metallo-hydrolase [Halobacillus salinus]|uniref:MBL fold metallo-hydrolase n=1 Tax=Halobacillus salinus TaxID=192814 RepID=A0A4Z0H170_9BACI|nr:MBL fold metallo-hydrolase [Halobacillus salinus]TGB03597.1 MBL fold metallo-hydrolase [Halobacillus salinus]
MQKYICSTCGVQYPESSTAPSQCPICEEERQYVPVEGQAWTTHEALVESGNYRNVITKEEEGLYSITTTPKFGIGQTAYLIVQNGFTILWDCLTYLDQETVEFIQSKGGIDAIALSHPHYYSRQVDWAETFDAPVYIHQDDQEWVMEPSEHIQFWNGEEKELPGGITLHRLGGHFKGGAVLHWKNGDHGSGVLLTGDIIQVVQDTDWVSFMYSYPNLIPLPANKVQQMAEKVEPLEFSKLYNAFHNVVEKEAARAVQRSADRYIKALNGQWFIT